MGFQIIQKNLKHYVNKILGFYKGREFNNFWVWLFVVGAIRNTFFMLNQQNWRKRAVWFDFNFPIFSLSFPTVIKNTTSENVKNGVKIFFQFKWSLLRLKTPKPASKYFSFEMKLTTSKKAKNGIKKFLQFEWS